MYFELFRIGAIKLVGYPTNFQPAARVIGTKVAYLATSGHGKVGFTRVGQDADGAPHFIGGMRALVERGAMRYFLALQAYLDAPLPDQFETRLDHWYSASERFPRQLHEIDRATYLDLKRADRQRRLAAP